MSSRREKRENRRDGQGINSGQSTRNGRTQIFRLRVLTAEGSAHEWKKTYARDKGKGVKAPRDQTTEESGNRVAPDLLKSEDPGKIQL